MAIGPTASCWIVLAACGGAAAPLPANTTATANTGLELVARCATQAVELLGWNPVPDGAHEGAVIRTSLQYGGDPACAPLASDANASGFAIGGEEIDWDWGPKDQVDATTIHFRFSCRGCTTIETSVELPRRWHCFSWIELDHDGIVCEPDAAACERERGRIGATSSPCELRTGAAWCRRGTQTCSDTPWSCADSPTREPCERVP